MGRKVRQGAGMAILWLIIVGAAGGFVATRFMRVESDLPMTLILGISGAVIGSLVFSTLVAFATALAGFAGAILGAVGLIWLWKTYGRV